MTALLRTNPPSRPRRPGLLNLVSAIPPPPPLPFGKKVLAGVGPSVRTMAGILRQQAETIGGPVAALSGGIERLLTDPATMSQTWKTLGGLVSDDDQAVLLGTIAHGLLWWQYASVGRATPRHRAALPGKIAARARELRELVQRAPWLALSTPRTAAVFAELEAVGEIPVGIFEQAMPLRRSGNDDQDRQLYIVRLTSLTVRHYTGSKLHTHVAAIVTALLGVDDIDKDRVRQCTPDLKHLPRNPRKTPRSTQQRGT